VKNARDFNQQKALDVFVLAEEFGMSHLRVEDKTRKQSARLSEPTLMYL